MWVLQQVVLVIEKYYRFPSYQYKTENGSILPKESLDMIRFYLRVKNQHISDYFFFFDVRTAYVSCHILLDSARMKAYKQQYISEKNTTKNDQNNTCVTLGVCVYN